MIAADADVTRALRGGFVALGALSIGGTAVELAIERHWSSAIQFVPWGALTVLAGALALLLTGPEARRLRLVRVLTIAVGLTALFGVYEHIDGNYHAGFLDRRYERTWSTMSPASRWWASATKEVGPAPPLAPLILVEAAACVWFAGLGVSPRAARESRSPERHPTGFGT